MNDVLVRVEGVAGRITLNRPQALNALTHAMVRGIHRALDEWRDDPRVTRIVIDGAGDRAFCGGGDIRYLYEHGRSDPASCRAFWRDEYRLNAAIANYPKPYISLMRGIVMGGGIGVSAHGSHRIVGESSRLAMPEVSIGFLPDVGGTMLLGHAPGALGLYLGLAAERFGAADAIHTGFADRFVPDAALPDLIAALVADEPVDIAIDAHATSPGGPKLAAHRADIDHLFGAGTLKDVLTRAEALRHDATVSEQSRAFAASVVTALSRHAPLSIACAFETIRRGRAFNRIEDALALEYRFAWRCLERGDLYEGIRAAILSRDVPPKWDPVTLAAVPATLVDEMLAPLGADELRFD
jgi:enoyl-CoA hydratase